MLNKDQLKKLLLEQNTTKTKDKIFSALGEKHNIKKISGNTYMVDQQTRVHYNSEKRAYHGFTYCNIFIERDWENDNESWSIIKRQQQLTYEIAEEIANIITGLGISISMGKTAGPIPSKWHGYSINFEV